LFFFDDPDSKRMCGPSPASQASLWITWSPLVLLVFLAQVVVAKEDFQSLLKLRRRCARPASWEPARVPGDLEQLLGPLESGSAFSELSPEVLSTDPWVVYFRKFLAEDEVIALESHLFTRQFEPSGAGYGGEAEGRVSETALCPPPCDEHPAVQALYQRASNVTHVPIVNFDFVQAARYKPGNYFAAHHDNHPTFHHLPCGTRIFSIFVYLTDVEEGGATAFPQLGLQTQAKRGAAVLFQNTLDSDPEQTDDRTEHEALPVVRGEKRGLNMWLYHYNYRDMWAKGCTSIELADDLAEHGLTTAIEGDDAEQGNLREEYLMEEGEEEMVEEDEEDEDKSLQHSGQKGVVFENTSPVAVEIFWVKDLNEEEQSLGISEHNKPLSLNTFPGHTFHARLKAPGQKLVRKYTVNDEPGKQVIDVTPPGKHQTQQDEL